MPNLISHVKVLGWRANGDGIHGFGYFSLEDSYIRTSDDSLYIASGHRGVSIKRILTWNDANGSSFIFSSASGRGKNTVVSDSDVLYARASYAKWKGGRVFSQRGVSSDKITTNITISDIRIHDPLPTLSVFYLELITENEVHNSTFSNISFENISAKNFST